MKTTEQLFYLIQSLTKAEKRSFKLLAKQYAKDGSNNYTLLFDTIDKMEKYDHQTLINKLRGKLNITSVSTLKVQLNELILKSLRQHSASYSQSLKIRQNIDYVEILFEKGLYQQCKKLIEKTKEAARNDANYLALDRLSIMEYNIALKQSDKSDLEHFVNVTYPEVAEARKHNDMLAEFEYLTLQMRLFLLESTSFGGNQTRERLNQIINHPLLKLDIENYPLHCQMDYHIIWGHYHYAFDHPDEMFFHRARVLEIAEQMNVPIRVWLMHARFLLIGLSTFKMFDKFDEYKAAIINKLDAIPSQKKSSNFEEEISNTLNNIQINRDLDEGNYSQILNYLEELEEKYSEDNFRLDDNLRMVFYFNFAYGHFSNGNYKKALYWVNNILNSSEMKSLRLDLHCYVRLMQICIHYKLGNYELIRPFVKSTLRYLKNQNRDISILTEFLRFANHHMIEPYNKSKEKAYNEATTQLRELATQEEGKIALEYFEFVTWLESEVENCSMEEIAKQRKTKLAS